ncbi:MAG: hypothetical protein ACXWUG_19740 [Polyangiales bacterium]
MLLAASLVVSAVQTFVLVRMLLSPAFSALFAVVPPLVLVALGGRPEEGLALSAELCALFFLLRDSLSRGPSRPAIVALLLAIACLGAPAAWLAAVAVGGFLWLERRRDFVPFLLAALVSFGALVLFSESRFHTPLPQKLFADLEPVHGPVVWLSIALAASLLAVAPAGLARLATLVGVLQLVFFVLSPWGSRALFSALPFFLVALAIAVQRSRPVAAIASLVLVPSLALHAKVARARVPVTRVAPPEPPRTIPPVHVEIGEPASKPFLVAGFSSPEQFFRWTDGHRATLRLDVPPLDPDVVDVDLVISLTPFLAEDKRFAQHVTLTVDGRPSAKWIARSDQPTPYRVTIPRALVGRTMLVSFDLPDAISPEEIGLGPDRRVLGIALHWVELRPRVGQVRP